jgi:hypothetical protein
VSEASTQVSSDWSICILHSKSSAVEKAEAAAAVAAAAAAAAAAAVLLPEE